MRKIILVGETVKFRKALIIIGIPLLILIIALAGGSILMMRLFFFSLLVLLLSYLWAFFNLYGIEIRIKTSSEHSQVGEWFDEEITVLNRTRLPKPIITIKEANLSLKQRMYRRKIYIYNRRL